MLIAIGYLAAAVTLAGAQSDGQPDVWVMQDSGVSVSLRGLFAVDARVAWAAGAEGTWLRTTDGGNTWHSGQVVGSETLDFRDVHAFGPDTAVLLSAGSPGRVVRTEDGGRTWRMIYNDDRPEVFFNCMDFEPGNDGEAGGRRGYIIGDAIEGRFQMLTTTDTGRSWQRLSPSDPPQPVAGEAQFAASGSCLQARRNGRVWFITGGAAARVFSSSDAGQAWRVAATPLLQGEGSQGGFSIAGVDQKSAVIVGGDYRVEEGTERNYAVTRDGGRTWLAAAGVSPRGFRSAAIVLAADLSEGATSQLITVGPSGTDVSTDAGANWEPLSDEGFHAISATRAGDAVWAAGSDGRIARLREGQVTSDR